MIQAAKRLASIDVFRAVNMFFMIFVNDLSGVKDVPKWIDHVKGWEDNMHFADTIFPLFLFIAGLSIPLAIGRRLDKGESVGSIAVYILLRSFALIVMGFFHVNMEEYSKQALLPLGVWELLLTTSFFLIWLDYPETMAKAKKYTLTGLGVAILIVLAILYKGDGQHGQTRWMEPSWWGILGIIGWAYLVCSLLFLIFRGGFTAMLISVVIFLAVNVAVHGKLIHFYPPVINDGDSESLMMFGVVISLLYTRLTAGGSYSRVWWSFILIGIGLVVLGFVLRPYTDGISKIRATPAWVLICTGIGVVLFEFFIWLVDVKGKQAWFNIIKPAGTSTLTCYLIPYYMVAIMYTINFFSMKYYAISFDYIHFFNYGAGGIIRSFGICFIVIFITGFLEKRRLRLKI
jgi:predicted acyltransferase